MTWTCPTCEQRYPDSGIGLPESADADEMTHCEACGTGGYIDVREFCEPYRRAECWNCGNSWLERRFKRVCHECYMGQEQHDHDGECYVDGYTDYGKLWYGEVDDRSEYQDLYEDSTKDVREKMQRSRAHDREVRLS